MQVTSTGCCCACRVARVVFVRHVHDCPVDAFVLPCQQAYIRQKGEEAEAATAAAAASLASVTSDRDALRERVLQGEEAAASATVWWCGRAGAGARAAA